MPAGDAGEGDAAPPEDDSPLLAVPPGSRDAPRTYGRHEKYYAKNGKNDKRRGAGPRSRSLKAKAGQKDSSGLRNVFPGSETMITNTVPSIAKGFVEQDESIYTLIDRHEESKLFEVNDSVRNLLKDMENKNLLTEQQDEDKAQ